MAFEITDKNFQEVISGDKPVMVDFWADWCAPCRMLGPIVEEIAKDYEGKAVVGKLDVVQNPSTPAQFGISGIPAILVFKNGELVARQTGLVGKEVLTKMLEAQL